MIYIDLPEVSDEMLIVHGYSGVIDKVPRRIATYLRKNETTKLQRPLYGAWKDNFEIGDTSSEPTDSEIQRLVNKGYLTDLDADQEECQLIDLVTAWHEDKPCQSLDYIIMPTYDCNLRCPYCFQDELRKETAPPALRKPISREIVERIAQSFSKIEAAHEMEQDQSRERLITLFGGEPLLKENHSLIQYIIERIKKEGPARFNAVTNATELDAYSDLLGPDSISHIQITLDGPASEHDQRRVYQDGHGSFDLICRNITMALEKDVKIQVRVNVDSNNLHQLPELAREIEHRGWGEQKGLVIYVSPINASNDSTDRKTTISIPELRNYLIDESDKNPELRVFTGPDSGLKEKLKGAVFKEGNTLKLVKSRFCSAHDNMYVFDPHGDVYACWEKTGDKALRIGHLSEDGNPVPNKDELSKWRMRTAVSNPTCSKCRYVLFCGGGCAALAESRHGDIYGNYCNNYGDRFRAALAEISIETHR